MSCRILRSCAISVILTSPVMAQAPPSGSGHNLVGFAGVTNAQSPQSLRVIPIQHHGRHRVYLGCVRSDDQCSDRADDRGLDRYRAAHSDSCEEEHGEAHFACYGWDE